MNVEPVDIVVRHLLNVSMFPAVTIVVVHMDSLETVMNVLVRKTNVTIYNVILMPIVFKRKIWDRDVCAKVSIDHISFFCER